ncbi:HindIII family type II restriction endonuclease [Bernardetia sp.]|uniref:HindIII family type II restriction endonuclease n=1 Tax=Bernardetia sp. TaxID=1937974 RepID=UPI0025B9D28C|nr:HindIII family type II restriction endonuclease [Bernardetia sp.]
MRKELIELVFKIAKEKNAFEQLEDYVNTISKKKLVENIIDVGILPEIFNHDSSEEKIWAKLSDIFLAKSLNYLGIKSEVLGARGNSADVIGRTKEYTLVADAKTFRLSRTAKNQKDFKVNALDTWRETNNYALLVAPLAQYPNRKSQIYSQAILKNVTLLSYTHLHFLLDYHNQNSFKSVLETGKVLAKQSNLQRQNAIQYWEFIDKIVAGSVNQSVEKIKEYRNLEIQKTKQIGLEGISYWNDKIKSFKQLSKDEAIRLLIKSQKIENKIKTIEKTINISTK